MSSTTRVPALLVDTDNAARWVRRSLLIRGSFRFPVFDLAASYTIDPSLVTVEEIRARLHRNLWVEFGQGDRPLRVVRALDAEAIWRLFAGLVSGRRAGDSSLPPRSPR